MAIQGTFNTTAARTAYSIAGPDLGNFFRDNEDGEIYLAIKVGAAAGNWLSMSDVDITSSISAFMETVLDDTTAATARATLGAGDVVGPASATDNAIARYDATTGKLLQNSGVAISDTGVLSLGLSGGGISQDGGVTGTMSWRGPVSLRGQSTGAAIINAFREGGAIAADLFKFWIDNATTAALTLTGAGHLLRKGQTGLTASATQTQGQAPIISDYNRYTTVGTMGDAATLPSAVANMMILVVNDGANDMSLFPAVDDDAGGGVDAAITVAASACALMWAVDATTWRRVVLS